MRNFVAARRIANGVKDDSSKFGAAIWWHLGGLQVVVLGIPRIVSAIYRFGLFWRSFKVDCD